MNANLQLDLSGRDLPVPMDVRKAIIGDDLVVHRALPSKQLRTVGHWCFLDHMGPLEYGSGEQDGLHVGSHPHIGLQTFTWMIEGQVRHRDSLGNDLVISAGQVNIMTAGRGISHTEDSYGPARKAHGAQLWIALPEEHQDVEPAFAHHPQLPSWTENNCTVTVMAGSCGEYTAPVHLYSPLLGVDVTSAVAQGGTVKLPLRRDFEYALMVLRGTCRVSTSEHSNTTEVAADEFVYWPTGQADVQLELEADSQIILLGGTPMSKPLTIWWNFVGYDRERLRQAWHDWVNNTERFGRIEGMEHTRLTAPALVI